MPVTLGAGTPRSRRPAVRSGLQAGLRPGVHPGSTRPPARGNDQAGYVKHVFGVDVPHVIAAVRTLGLVTVVITVSTSTPHPSLDGGRGTGVAIALGISAAAWIVWIAVGRREPVMTGALIVLAGAGGVLAGLSPQSPAVGMGCVATFSAGVRLRASASFGIVAETVAAFLITALAIGA